MEIGVQKDWPIGHATATINSLHMIPTLNIETILGDLDAIILGKL